MKAELTNENKARFFALYYDQLVLFQASFVKGIDLASICSGNDQTRFGEPAYLTLKPLSSISDEDAIELGYKNCNDQLNANYGMSASGCFFDDWTQREDMLMSDSDFLRFRGYALPWMGLSVDEMVSAGWIKLTES